MMKCHAGLKDILGFSLAAGAGITFSSFVGCSQQLQVEGVDLFVILLFTYILQLPVTAALISYSHTPWVPTLKELPWLTTRVVTCMLGNIFILLAAGYLPLGEAATIHNSTILFAMIFGRIFLGEKCDWKQLISLGLTLIGSALVVQPELIFNHAESEHMSVFNRLIGAAFTMASAASFAATNVVHRHGLRDTNPAMVNLYICLASVCIYGACVLAFGSKLSMCMYATKILMILCTTFAFSCILLNNLCLRYIEAGLSTLCYFACYMITGFVIQTALGVTSNVWTISGAALVLAGLLINGATVLHSGWRQHREEKDTAYSDVIQLNI